MERRMSQLDSGKPVELLSETNEAIERFEDTTVVQSRLSSLIELSQQTAEEVTSVSSYDDHIHAYLKDLIFVGHINTDLDSVAGAIGGAALFGGVPAISESNLNGEILFALKECNLETPQLFDEIIGAKPGEGAKKICLVDHTEVKQMTKILRDDPQRGKRIGAVIDHHALAETMGTSKPIFMDIRPWGSMSTIVAYLFLAHQRRLPQEIAKILLMAILSDTLSLRSVTTTDADRETVALLARFAQVDDPDELARKQFQAKTDWIVTMGAYGMVRGDQKDFATGKWKLGISVLEVTTVEPVLRCCEEIIMELRLLKKEKGCAKEAQTRNRKAELDFAFLFVVDIVNQTSYLVVAGGRELALARAAFPDARLREARPNIAVPGHHIRSEETLAEMAPGMVSRKLQFAPAFLDTLAAGFTCHKIPCSEWDEEQETADPNEKVFLEMEKAGWDYSTDGVQKVVRNYSAMHLPIEAS